MLNVVYALICENQTEEKLKELDRALDWPVDEADLRAGWGEGPEAEAAQQAMMRMTRGA